MTADPSLPAVDLSLPEEEAARVMRRACIDFGFLYVVNHGVPEELVAHQFEQQRKFFSLPLEQKMRILADVNNRGYTPLGDETLDPTDSKAPDTHEGLYFGREVAPDSEEARLPLHGPNQWPPEEELGLPGYRAAVLAYFDALHGLGMRLLRVLALALGLPADHFGPCFSRPMLALRPLHYPATRSRPEEGLFAAGAHTDYGMLTLLSTDDVPGLQLFSKERRWVDVPPLPGAFIVNLGDMLQRWTGGLFASTLHRVVNREGRERYSLPFFFEPNFDTVVEVLPCCRTPDTLAYPPVTSGQWLLDRYAATHAGYSSKMKEGAAGRTKV